MNNFRKTETENDEEVTIKVKKLKEYGSILSITGLILSKLYEKYSNKLDTASKQYFAYAMSNLKDVIVSLIDNM